MIVGAVNFVSTWIAFWIVDRVGRKPLLLAGSAGMGTSLALLGASLAFPSVPGALVFVLILLYVGFFAIGLGPVVWLLMSEIFPTRIRGRAMSIATISLWAACLVVSMTFLSLVEAITAAGTFWVYAALCAATFVFVWRAVPETKCKTLEEVERMWKQQCSIFKARRQSVL